MRIAAIADLHYRVNSAGLLWQLMPNIEHEADLLVLAGDLTDTGQPAELEILLNDLRQVSLPKITVLGNHDHESDKGEELIQLLRQEGILFLQGSVVEIDGIGFVGTKGFAGGFDNHLIQPFGERQLKDFINESVAEAVQLENALSKLDCQHRVAILHYAPIKATLEGESPELYPFLGSSRLANALDRHGVDVIVHGHAHHGFPQGKTAGGIPVYNVCRFVQTSAGNRAYCLLQV